jgi:membrane fusion protein (multidrug efflux system)
LSSIHNGLAAGFTFGSQGSTSTYPLVTDIGSGTDLYLRRTVLFDIGGNVKQNYTVLYSLYFSQSHINALRDAGRPSQMEECMSLSSMQKTSSDQQGSDDAAPYASAKTSAGQSGSVMDATAKRKKGFRILAAVIAVVAIAYAIYWQFIGARYVSTDNAYTAAEIAQVTPSVSGIVREVKVVDTQPVKKGDVLIVIDDVDAKLALAQAEAELNSAMRRVRVYQANDEGLSAQVAARTAEEKRAAAELLSAETDLARNKSELERREALVKSGAISAEALTTAKSLYETAIANLRAKKAAAEQARANHAASLGALDANAALINDADIETQPEVLLARAKRDQAKIDLQRTVIRAPVDGVVARRQVQIGERVQTGAALLSIVPLQDVYVDANFKEVQLANVRVGQKVTLTSDLYGDDVEYHGIVEGLSGGTGSTFAIIPAQNATGNWIKVVQRLPVRIKLNIDELKTRPLQVGLSMNVTIDTESDVNH